MSKVFIQHDGSSETKARVTYIHNSPSELPNSMLSTGLLVERIPAIEHNGMDPELYIKPENNQLWYEYKSPTPKSPDQLYRELEKSSVPFDEVKQMKIAQLNYLCNASILSDFTSAALGMDHEYGFDMEDQANLIGRLAGIAAGTASAEFLWKTKDAGPLLHTVEQFKQLCRDGDAQKEAKIGKYWTLKAQVEEATSLEAVEAVQW